MHIDAQIPSVAEAARTFVMINAPICDPVEAGDELTGYYDPESQTWVGNIQIGAGTHSSRSNGSRGGYSYQADD